MADLSLSKLPANFQLLVFILLAVAGAGTYYMFYDMPAQEALAAKTAELTTIRGRITTALATARRALQRSTSSTSGRS